MAQSNFEERIDTYEIESTNVMTGDRDRSRYLYYQLKMSMAKAKRIDIIVSFLMESGVRMLLNDMKRALERGVKIRILTGNYLGITQPSALYLIKSELGDRVDLRLYNETSRSFHPKSYIFHYESSNEIYIGSSNISKSALTSGIEWNYRFSDILDKKNYELFYATFEDLFLNHSIIIDDEELKRYSKAWKKPAVSRDLAKYDTAEDNEDRNTENVRMLYRPRGAQIEALYQESGETMVLDVKYKDYRNGDSRDDRLQLLAYSMMMNANNIGIILPAQDEVEIFDARRINSMENRVVKYHQMLLGVMKDNPVIANYIKTNAFKKKE